MTADSDGLYEIANTAKADRQADIVFVHGLGGASHGTWRHGREGKSGHFFWPEELGRDLPHCGIWTIGYPAGFTALGKPGMIIDKRAGNLAQKLANAGLGVRPLLFITHSMGGLVVKALIVGSQTLADTDRKRIVSMVRGMVFCATPHRGSAFADAAGVLGTFLGGSQDHVDEMRANAEPLDILHDGFIEWHRNHPIPIESYAENVGLFRTRWWRRPLPLGLVVPRASANPGIAGHTVRDVDDDHLTLVKPRDRKHDVYAGVLRFVPIAMAFAPRATLSPSVTALATTRPVVSETPPVGIVGIRADLSRIIKYAPAELIGRTGETKLLSDAWDRAVRGEEKRPRVVTFVALGGEGKTSLVARWAVDEMLAKGWPGCDAAFAWSFYSQGTREQLAASSDLFLKEALTFFGDDADKEFAASPASAFEKGQRLARLVSERRSLLILDGLEPLQYAPSSTAFPAGQLKDQGVAKLLKDLAAANHGLCIVTTRHSLPDLKAFWQTTAPEMPLLRLSRDAGVHLLKTLGVRGTAQEFETLVEDVKGHALTLILLGGFLKRAFHGDIRQRDRVKFEKADEKMDGGHAFRTMAAYEQWLLRDGGDEGRREVAVLRLMGLFDRPADAGCLAALRSEIIPGLTEPLAGLADDDWEYCLSGLEAAKLLTVNRDATGALVSLDAHPHLREYFARQLRTQQPDAWRAAHRRLYEHLCATTPDKPRPTLEDLQPLYQAVAHGCQAGLSEEARVGVYRDRILLGPEQYSFHKLGAFGSDLGAIACLFDEAWKKLLPGMTRSCQSWLFNQAAFCLRALGRLTEALESMRVSGKMDAEVDEWEGAAISYSGLSELELTLGEVAGAVGDAEQSMTYADRSGDAFWKMGTRTAHAGALYQAGRRAEAETRFREAEQMQKEWQPGYPLLYSVQGFWYCDLLLAAPERAAWRAVLNSESRIQNPELIESCRAVSQRAAQTLKWAEMMGGQGGLLDPALDHLTLGRAALYAAILAGSPIQPPKSEIENAVSGLRRAGDTTRLPHGLLTRAWLRFLIGTRTGPESAQEDLDEAWEIAERGPMKLFLADIHLHRARLFFREKSYPWKSPQDDLTAAEKLITTCGYHRRDEELADAKKAILS